jgi:hypothetical protein
MLVALASKREASSNAARRCFPVRQGTAMSVQEALLALAEPPPEPFRQVGLGHDDFVRWDAWNAKRIEALKVAGRL